MLHHTDRIVIDITEQMPEYARDMIDSITRAEQSVPLWLGIAVFLACGILGLVSVLAPEAVWQFQHRFTVQGGEPTDFYLITTRISGVLLTALGIFALIISIVSQL